MSELEDAAGVKSVTGRGLMIGILPERPAGDVLADLRREGVLALKAKDKVRLLPPLNIPDGDLVAAAGIIKKVCAK